LKRIFTNWWVVTGLCVLLLILTFAVGLPIFVGMLRPWWIRLAIAAFILAVWGLFAFLRIRKARKASAAIARELTQPSAGDEESTVLATRMAEAMATLKNASGKRRDYLYTRPWYVIIGPPGAGKTTAIVNSGLHFPLAAQAYGGIGGTRNLDFWFADEAALVDTAGRYTTQDSDVAVDAQGWRSFLTLMKRNRPLQPINGVMVMIGVDELLRNERAQIDAHAVAVRRRLMELRATLEVAVPVYLVLTKADLIAGFTEFYEDLDVEGRRAVLGTTLPGAMRRPDIDTVLKAFDEVVSAQSERQAKRLHEEVDQNRRSLILGFPSQLGLMRTRLARFVEGAFILGDHPSATLRGVYLTSGIQEGAPLDKMLSGVAQVFDRSSGARGESGRAYFLNRLLTEVIFGEAGLVQMDPVAKARARARTVGGLAAVAAVAALVLIVWGVSFYKNRSFQSQLLASSQEVQSLTRQTGLDLAEVRASDPDLEQSLAVLRALRNLPQGYQERMSGQPGLFRTFGLYQSSQSEGAVEAYRNGLRRILLPRILMRLETFLAANSSNPMALYEPLKVYLMIGGQGPLDRGAVKNWVTDDWAAQVLPGPDRAAVREELEDHLSALLDDPNMSAAWPEGKTPLDGTTVASARAAVQTLGLADRAYAILRQKAASSGEPPWQASTVISTGDVKAFANGEEVRALTVPYFYTRTGFEKAYQLGLVQVPEELRKDIWVLGGDAANQGIQAQMSGIRPGIAALYARDYIAAWERVIAAPKPAAYFEDQAAFGAITKTPSPLKMLLLAVRSNTTFSGGTGAAARIATASIANRLGRATELVPTGGGGVDAGTEISSYFKPIQEYVGDGKTPGARIDEFLTKLKDAGTAVISAKLAGGGIGSSAAQGALANAMGALATASVGAPPQVQGFVASASQGGVKAQTTAATGAISDIYSQSVLPDCKLATQDKYPFFGNSKDDAAIVDVQRVMGMGGTVENFVQQQMMPLLDTSGPVWRWKADSDLVKGFDPASPDEFAKARELRDLLVGGLSLKIEVQMFGGGVTAAEFSAGGTTYRFDKATMSARPLIWSAQGNLPQASVTLFKDTNTVSKIETQGPWALFRLMDLARKENSGPQTILATFGEGDASAVFRISLPSERNPFGRGGLWSFRCPTML
jgi:type VI secretion system protein ImpL